MKKRVVLFDIDGTLLTTGGAGMGALNGAFESIFAVSGAFDGISFVGSMDCNLFSKVSQKCLGRELEPSEAEALSTAYVHRLREAFPQCPFKVYAQASEVVKHLANDPNMYLGLATGNLEAAAWAKLEYAKLDHYFQIGGFGMQGPTREDMTRAAWESTCDHFGIDSDPKNGVLIGDSVHDIRCALEIGVTAVGITTGWTDAATLRNAGAHAVIDSMSELKAILYPSD